jgi:hypothetical protein
MTIGNRETDIRQRLWTPGLPPRATRTDRANESPPTISTAETSYLEAERTQIKNSNGIHP